MGGSYNECLKLKPGKEKAAAFLETRRYAALKGATTELNKEEGITYNPASRKLYIAMSDVSNGMKPMTAVQRTIPKRLPVTISASPKAVAASFMNSMSTATIRRRR